MNSYFCSKKAINLMTNMHNPIRFVLIYSMGLNFLSIAKLLNLHWVFLLPLLRVWMNKKGMLNYRLFSLFTSYSVLFLPKDQAYLTNWDFIINNFYVSIQLTINIIVSKFIKFINMNYIVMFVYSTKYIKWSTATVHILSNFSLPILLLLLLLLVLNLRLLLTLSVELVWVRLLLLLILLLGVIHEHILLIHLCLELVHHHHLLHHHLFLELSLLGGIHIVCVKAV